MKLWQRLKRAWKNDEEIRLEFYFDERHLVLVAAIVVLILINVL